MKLAIVGSRGFTDYAILCYEIDSYGLTVTEIVSGGAHGADTLAGRYAKERNLPLTVFVPNWNIGRHAGMLRNSQIVNHCDRLIAFWDGKSPGTKDSIAKARKSGKLINVIMYREINGFREHALG